MLRERLAGCDEWDEFEATSVARPILDGLGNEDEFRTDHWGGFVAMSFRFFDPATRRVVDLLGRQPPQRGARCTGLRILLGRPGVFEGADTFAGRPILVRFVWSGVTTATPRWEQSFSDDGGETWEPNWVMEFTRTGDDA